MDLAEGKIMKICPVGDNTSLISNSFDETSTTREKDSCVDKEHPQERRSTRLERLRSRKSGKEEQEFSNSKDLGKIVFRFLEPFVLNRSRNRDNDCSGNSYGPITDSFKYSTSLEYKNVVQFISRASKNFGVYHLGHLLLEEVSCIDMPFQDSFFKFLKLEKLTRHWGQDRTPLCSLFLAELYYDQGSLSCNESKRSELFSEASYHLCKVIEMVALDTSNDLAGIRGPLSNSEITAEVNDPNKTARPINCVAETTLAANNSDNSCIAKADESSCQEFAELDPILTNNTAFWVRFFWLSGRLSLYSDNKDKALKEFCICLSLLENDKTVKETPYSVFLPHCKLVRSLTVGIVRNEINLLNLEALLGTTIKEMIDGGMYAKCIDLLSPLLLSNTDEVLSSASKESERVISLELSALNVLMTACEKAEPLNVELYLSCHRRKLQILTLAAGMVDSPASQKNRTSISKTSIASDLDTVEIINKKLTLMVTEEVKDISQIASQVKSIIDQRESHVSFCKI